MFVNWALQKKKKENEDFSKNIPFSDEAHVHMGDMYTNNTASNSGEAIAPLAV